MLNHLSIRNFALIERLDIDFNKGMSIITGETGAGKSIILGALGLVLGKRADLSSLKDKETKCVIEAHFDIKNYNLQPLFTELELDYEDITLIRREILPSGKSRAFVNDSPVNLSSLQELGTFLLDIHSQHQTHELVEEQYQIGLLDAVAQNQNLLEEYRNLWGTYKKKNSELKHLVNERSELIKEHDYNSFLLQELQVAQLEKENQEELEQDQKTLSNIENIREYLIKSNALISGDDFGILSQTKEVKMQLQKLSAMDTHYVDFAQRIESVLLEVQDLANEMEQSAENLVNDPERLNLVNQKLQHIYSLQKKHNVGTLEELLQIQSVLESKVSTADQIDDQIASLTKIVEELNEQLNGAAEKITNSRGLAAPILMDQITAILQSLGMENARFEYENVQSSSFLANGKDQIQLLFAANKGGHFGPLKKVASGGEMSRIMLAIKSILSKYSKLPTIIFDEIDTGVSGEIANKMAEIMFEMSAEMQVFVITHLPQVASRGDFHYKVAKSVQNDTTVSELKLLTQEERIVQIAEMISGQNYTESALVHAKELLRIL
ncbi:MAG: DNA repair protein RecN [Flavobacterium sp.]|nr:DNA repair protein RecN [Candidatus Neoflavobacterium equi]